MSGWLLNSIPKTSCISLSIHSAAGKNGDIDLVSLAVEDFPVHARVEFRPVEKRKVAASACHASQGGGSTISSPIQWIFKLFLGRPHDTFMRVYPAPETDLMETDLFAGIE